MIYEAQGRNDPTTLSENFDPSIFTHIYAEKAERERLVREHRRRLQRAMSTLTEQLQNGQELPTTTLSAMINVIDVDMEDDQGDQSSNWELGSGVGSEESEQIVADEGVTTDAL